MLENMQKKHQLQPGIANALTAAMFVLLLFACTWLSWPALTGPFLFDDFPNLQHLAGLGGEVSWRSLADYMRQYGGTPGRPLSMLSFVINDFTWPSEPWSFKYTNLMLHLLVGVLVYGLARSLARLRTDAQRANLAALLAMAAWLLHPMQLSTSMLVVQRMTQLSALFVLTGLWGYVALAHRATTQRMAVASIAALGIGTVLAVLCKETGALAPLLAVVINATLLRDRLRELPSRSRHLLHWGTMLPVLVMLAVIALRWDSASNFSGRDFSMRERVLTEARVLVNYLYQILLPNLRGGGIYHDDFIVSRGLLQPWTTLPAIILITGLVLSALALHRRWPLFTFAVLWFFGGHLLESTVFPLELYFEHRNYLPMFGPLFALALWVASAPQQWRRAALILAAVWIVFAAWLTWVQAPIWGSTRKLTAVWAVEHPDSARAMAHRAQYLNNRVSSQLAADTLLDAYRRGVRGGSFPVQALNIACASKNTVLVEQAWPLAIEQLKSGHYNRALLETMGKLRHQTQHESCPNILTGDDWLTLTTMLLNNPKYAASDAQNYIHVQRASLFRHRRNFNATMREFEAAWAARPSPKLAQLIAATFVSAGLYNEAHIWADRALEHRLRGFQGWLSDDDDVSRRLQKAILKAQKKQDDNQVRSDE